MHRRGAERASSKCIQLGSKNNFRADNRDARGDPHSRPALAAQTPAFNVYFSGTENLVLERLELDPSTHGVSDLSAAQTAIFDDTLPATGPALEALKARVAAGMGVVIVTGPNTRSGGAGAL